MTSLAHERQLEAAHWLTVQDLAARWAISAATVRKVPREKLPYLLFGDSQVRRYAPADVDAFEETNKRESAA